MAILSIRQATTLVIFSLITTSTVSAQCDGQTEQREIRPSDGEDGDAGRNTLVRALDGREVNLGNKNSVEVRAGDLLRIATPGGGGFGSKPKEK